MGSSTARPTNTAVLIDQKDVADLAVKQANRFADVIGETSSHKEILVPVLLGELSSQGSHEEPHQPGLASIILIIDVDDLCGVGVLRQCFVKRGVFFLGSKGCDLLLSPTAAEETDDRCLAGEERSGIAWVLVRLQEGFAVKVGEE